MYHASIIKCPHCGRPFEVRMFGLYSGLGPETVECSNCGKEIDTERTESMHMSSGQRLVFVVVSLIYAGMLGLIGGNCLDNAYQLSQHVPEPANLRFGADSFQDAAIACGVAALVIQLYRLARSAFRSRSKRKMKTLQYLLGLDMNMQFKCLGAVVLIWLAAKIAYS